VSGGLGSQVITHNDDDASRFLFGRNRFSLPLAFGMNTLLNAAMYATGNNLTLTGDMIGRTRRHRCRPFRPISG
jgi:hypothetical protein